MDLQYQAGLATLASLPPELLLKVTDHLPEASSLAALARSCQRMKNILTPKLYNDDMKLRDCSALRWSCEYGNLLSLTKALSFGASIDHKFVNRHRLSSDQDTPLLLAIRNRKLDIARFLITQGADVKTPASGGPLLVAVIDTYRDGSGPPVVLELNELLEMLLKKGADPNNYRSWANPLARVMYPEIPLAPMELLIRYGADPMRRLGSSMAWHIWQASIMGQYRLRNTEAHVAVQKFRLLLEHSDVSLMSDHNGESIIHSLAESCIRGSAWNSNRIKLFEALLETGIDPNTRSPIKGDTPLERIARHMESVPRPPRPQNYHALQSLHEDVQYEEFLMGQTLIICLLNSGANPNLVGGSNMMDVRIGRAPESVLSTLVKCHWHAGQAISELIFRDADHTIKDEKGRGLLHYACAAQNLKLSLISILLDLGLDPDEKDSDGHSPMYALLVNTGIDSKIRYEAIKLLIYQGASVDTRDAQGSTAGSIVGLGIRG